MDKKAFEKGQGFIEYAFIIVLIAIVLMITLELFGISVIEMFTNIRATIAVY